LLSSHPTLLQCASSIHSELHQEIVRETESGKEIMGLHHQLKKTKPIVIYCDAGKKYGKRNPQETKKTGMGLM
jgi:hypothetical protein